MTPLSYLTYRSQISSIHFPSMVMNVLIKINMRLTQFYCGYSVTYYKNNGDIIISYY